MAQAHSCRLGVLGSLKNVSLTNVLAGNFLPTWRFQRASVETWHAKPLKTRILRFKSFRNNILARPGQRSSIVTPYSPKIWTSNPPKKFDPDRSVGEDSKCTDVGRGPHDEEHRNGLKHRAEPGQHSARLEHRRRRKKKGAACAAPFVTATQLTSRTGPNLSPPPVCFPH